MDNNFLILAKELETIGLKWIPEVGDEVLLRGLQDNRISILIDSNGMTLYELRENYIWVPTIEQLMREIEHRGGVLFHAGAVINDKNIKYEVVIQTLQDIIKVTNDSLREALALSLKKLILNKINEKKIS